MGRRVRPSLDIPGPMWRFRFIPGTYDIRCKKKSRLDGAQIGGVDESKDPALSRTGFSDVLGRQVRNSHGNGSYYMVSG